MLDHFADPVMMSGVESPTASWATGCEARSTMIALGPTSATACLISSGARPVFSGTATAPRRRTAK